MNINNSYNYGFIGLLTACGLVVIGNIVITYLLLQIQDWIKTQWALMWF